MASKTKNPIRTKAINLFRKAEKAKRKYDAAKWRVEHYGTTIIHSDRHYFIAMDGSYRLITDRADIIKNSMNYTPQEKRLS